MRAVRWLSAPANRPANATSPAQPTVIAPASALAYLFPAIEAPPCPAPGCRFAAAAPCTYEAGTAGGSSCAAASPSSCRCRSQRCLALSPVPVTYVPVILLLDYSCVFHAASRAGRHSQLGCPSLFFRIVSHRSPCLAPRSAGARSRWLPAAAHRPAAQRAARSRAGALSSPTPPPSPLPLLPRTHVVRLSSQRDLQNSSMRLAQEHSVFAPKHPPAGAPHTGAPL